MRIRSWPPTRSRVGTKLRVVVWPQGYRKDPRSNGDGATDIKSDAACASETTAANWVRREPEYRDVREMQRPSENRVQGLVRGFLDGEEDGPRSAVSERPRLLRCVQSVDRWDVLRFQPLYVNADRHHLVGRRDRRQDSSTLVGHTAGVACWPLASPGGPSRRLDGRQASACDEICQTTPGRLTLGFQQYALTVGARNITRVRQPVRERSARDPALRHHVPQLLDQHVGSKAH